MKALIYTGHPDWPDSLNSDVKHRWALRLSEIPAITSYRLYSLYGTTDEEMISNIEEDDDILIGFYPGSYMNDTFFSSHPHIQYIGNLAMGYGPFDREAAKRHHVTLTTTVYGDKTISQFAFALLLDICHNIRGNCETMKKASPEKLAKQYFNPIEPMIELSTKNMGIIGLGHVGFSLAGMAKAFGMNVYANSRSIKSGPEYDGISQVSLDELLKVSDVIAITCSGNASTMNLINKDTISKMKDGVIIINTSRGGIIVEEDLISALNTGKVRAAGLDATMADATLTHTPIMDCKNAIITPHIAYLTDVAVTKTIDVACENLKNYLAGKPTSVIAL